MIFPEQRLEYLLEYLCPASSEYVLKVLQKFFIVLQSFYFSVTAVQNNFSRVSVFPALQVKFQ